MKRGRSLSRFVVRRSWKPHLSNRPLFSRFNLLFVIFVVCFSFFFSRQPKSPPFSLVKLCNAVFKVKTMRPRWLLAKVLLFTQCLLTANHLRGQDSRTPLFRAVMCVCASECVWVATDRQKGREIKESHSISTEGPISLQWLYEESSSPIPTYQAPSFCCLQRHTPLSASFCLSEPALGPFVFS